MSVVYQEHPKEHDSMSVTYHLRPGEIRPGARYKPPGTTEWLIAEDTRSEGTTVVLAEISGPPPHAEHRFDHNERIEVAPAWDDGSTAEERRHWPECHWHCHEDCTKSHRTLDTQCPGSHKPWRDGERCDGDSLCCPAWIRAREIAKTGRMKRSEDHLLSRVTKLRDGQ